MNQHAARGALDTYQSTSVQTAVTDASPHRLIDMLMERALARIAIAKGHIQRSHIAEKGVHISGAMAIINGLRTFLDKEAGGQLAADLDALYEYISRRLLEANLRNEVETLDEVATLVREIRGAWSAIGKEVEGTASAAVPA